MARPRKPTRLKVLAGTMNPSRRNDDEPDVLPSSIPDPPPELTDTEKALWERYAQVIDPMRIVTDADFTMFQALVTATATKLELEACIRARPIESRYAYDTFSAKGGYMRRPQPDVGECREVTREVMALCTKFGLSPADRSRVSTDRSEGGRRGKEAEFGKKRSA